MKDTPWSHVIALGSVRAQPIRLTLEAGERDRARIARLLDLAELRSLKADVEVAAWFDGAEITADWQAEVVQLCGVSLDPLESAPSGRFVVRAVMPDSPHAPTPEAEIDLDPDAEDPPDVLESDQIDIAAYVVEHLALEIDPFPRKPGAEFEPPTSDVELSPFAVLKQFRKPGET